MCKIISIDVSKQTLDVSFKNGKWDHFTTSNDKKGFKKISSLASKGSWFVMEASGPYYLRLATYLYECGFNVSVVNPLVIRRYSQMRLMRAKTDKKDSKTIAEYAMSNTLKRWQPEDKQISNMRQLMKTIESFKVQIRQNKNQLEAFKSSGLLSNDLSKSLKSIIRSLERQCNRLEVELELLAEENYSQTIKRLVSIKGIGKKTAVMLVVVTNNFQKFVNHKQLIAYVGLSPRIFESGSSVKGRGHICKMGNSYIRKLLYMCTWAAKKYNKGCKEMYERLKSRGKPEKVIKVAMANKLLKQAFAIVTSKTMYDINYVSKYEPIIN